MPHERRLQRLVEQIYASSSAAARGNPAAEGGAEEGVTITELAGTTGMGAVVSGLPLREAAAAGWGQQTPLVQHLRQACTAFGLLVFRGQH
jgi:hypothetical protein